MALILVLEDDPVSQQLLKLLMQKAGHTLFMAQSTTEAWSVLKEGVLPECVIVDSQLQGNTKGIDFVRTFRDQPLFENVPIVACLTAPSRSAVVDFAKWKVQNVLVKPYVPDKIMTEVAKALEQKPYANLAMDEAAFCEKMKITPEAYKETIRIGLEEVAKTIPSLQEALDKKDWASLRQGIGCLKSLGTNLGLKILARACEKLGPALQNPESAFTYLTTAPQMISLIQGALNRHFTGQSSIPASSSEPALESSAQVAPEAVPAENG